MSSPQWTHKKHPIAPSAYRMKQRIFDARAVVGKGGCRSNELPQKLIDNIPKH